MPSISSEQPPLDTPPELREYLTRMFIQVNVALRGAGNYAPIYVMPAKPKEGNVYYFGQTISPDITAIGFWGKNNSGWTQL